jgi:hypothetical protein
MIWNLTTILGFLQRECDDGALTSTQVQQYAYNRIREIYARAREFAKDEGSFALVSGTRDYYLRSDVNLLLPMQFTNATNPLPRLRIRTRDWVLKRDPDESQTGTPRVAYFWGLSEVQAQPTSGSVVTIAASADHVDNRSKTVIVRGKVGGFEDYEEILTHAANATTPVSGSKVFTEVWNLRLQSALNCYLSATSNVGVVTLAVIPRGKGRCQYPKVGLWPKSDCTDTIRYPFYRAPIDMETNEDMPDIPDLTTPYFLEGLKADGFYRNYDVMQGGRAEGKFKDGLELLEIAETWAGDEQVYPGTGDPERDNPLADLADVDEASTE